MKMTVGQVPARALAVTLLDGRTAVDPTTYDAVSVRLVDPEGAIVDTSGGSVVLEDGVVRYLWPVSSLFATPGDYSMTLRCTKGAALDVTDPLIIEVRREAA